MREFVAIGTLTAFALLSQPALSFQETPVVPPSATDGQPQTQTPSQGEEASSFAIPEGELGDVGLGTEVRIPGLGTLGVIPKLDFGLELLYGAAESEVVEEDPLSDDELTIRGSVKHKF